MKKVVIILIILFFIAAVIVVGLFLKRRASGATPVLTESVEKRDIVKLVTAFGRLNPEVEVEISSKVIGQIQVLHVDEGDTVAKGDTLVELERNRYEAAVNSANASLRSSISEVARVSANLRQLRGTLSKTTTMFEKGLVSEDALLQAQTQVEVQEALLQSAQNNVERSRGMLDENMDDLARTTIIAPVSGVVISLTAEEGENVITGTMNNIGSVIMTIAQLDAMEAVVEVDEADVVNLLIGQTAKVEVDAFPDTFLTGEVVKIANSARLQNVGGQETVANFEVKISIPDPFAGIRPGMSCSAEIEVDKADSVLSLPIQSVVAAKEPETLDDTAKGPPGKRVGDPPKGGPARANGKRERQEAVFIVKDDIAHQQIVTTGIADDRYIEAKSGVAEGDIIVTGRYEALRELKDGDRISLIESDSRKGVSNARSTTIRIGH